MKPKKITAYFEMPDGQRLEIRIKLQENGSTPSCILWKDGIARDAYAVDTTYYNIKHIDCLRDF